MSISRYLHTIASARQKTAQVPAATIPFPVTHISPVYSLGAEYWEVGIVPGCIAVVSSSNPVSRVAGCHEHCHVHEVLYIPTH